MISAAIAAAAEEQQQADATTHAAVEVEYQYICVLDFEATCWEGSINKEQMEIIEFPSVLLRVPIDPADGSLAGGPIEQVAEFAEYVRPTLVPQLTPFCTSLTGIEQTTVAAAREFAPVFRDHMTWLWEHTQGAPCFFATCGHWDLKTQLPRELRRPHHGLRMSKIPSAYAAYINVKDEFEKLYRCKGGGMTDMLAFLHLPLVGRHHSGIDDTRNIAAILVRVLQDGRKVAEMRVNRVPREL